MSLPTLGAQAARLPERVSANNVSLLTQACRRAACAPSETHPQIALEQRQQALQQAQHDLCRRVCGRDARS